MSYYLDFSKQAGNDADSLKKSGNKVILKKLLVILNELAEHPFDGTGKPELLNMILLVIGHAELIKNID